MFFKMLGHMLKLTAMITVAVAMLWLFFIFTLPGFQKDWGDMVEKEMDVHNQTLEAIKQDFSYVLSTDNVKIEMDENINLVISGKSCSLNVNLNKELKVLSLETIDKTENTIAGLVFACIGEGIGVVLAIVFFCFMLKDMIDDIKFALERRKLIKQAKKQKKDIEVLV